MAEAKKTTAKATKKATKTVEKSEKPKAVKAKKPIDAEEPIAKETDITEAAIDAAEQEQAVITEKRSTEPVAEPEQRKTITAAKAGKRSAKALAADEAKQAKEERKTRPAAEGDAPKQAAKPARSRFDRKGKKYRELAAAIDKLKDYSLNEAIDLAIASSPVKFDATAELHINLDVDPRHADQNVRGNLVLPNGTGKSVRVAVLAEDEEAAKAKKAGADIAGPDQVLAALEKGVLDFDVLIATPSMMGKLGKYARLLGPKGLMPNPKSGTVTPNASKAVQDAKAGRVEYRVDSTGIVHCGFGKVSFGKAKLLENARAILGSIKSAKPASVKGSYIKSIYISTTMGPGIRITTADLL